MGYGGHWHTWAVGSAAVALLACAGFGNLLRGGDEPTATATALPTPSGGATPSSTPAPTLTHTPPDTITAVPSLSVTMPLPPIITPTPTIPAGDDTACIPRDTKREVAEVLSITDGDTIRVLVGGASYPVRYVGMDSPERGAPLSSEATAGNAELVDGETVLMVVDVSETDRYDRLLRYVVVGNRFVNLELVRSGLATAYDYPPDTACSDAFHEAEQAASLAAAGMWAAAPISQAAEPDCDPSYIGVCIPSPPPDLDCGDISFRRFTVLPPDPHRFDGDHDGVGCESS